ncbi:MAG TPA: MFS transporter [Thermoanaerobaculia bacterium]|nr:MFS transporter [Thermoanaerobaculia bacterium]
MTNRRKTALRFVLLVGTMDLFADFTYEGARGVAGPYLALLGASGVAVGAATGFGEMLGYGLRLVSGRLADRTRKFWPITIAGYVVEMAAIPLLALAGRWQVAVALLVVERIGKATRNPPRNAMLSHAGEQMGGYGWAFGLHEALDQGGAMLGPIAMALLLARRGDYRTAFAAFAIPAAITLLLLSTARILYPNPEGLETAPRAGGNGRYPRAYWIYLAAAAAIAAGFADFPLIAFHFQKSGVVRGSLVPISYAIAMGVSGAGSLVFGRAFDRRGILVLVPLTVVTAAYAPLAFLGTSWVAIAGVVLWGLGMGVHESILAAVIATMVGAERRASAYGLFTAGFGIAWFLGSALLGELYDVSIPALVAVSAALELAAIPFLVAVARRA